MMYLIYNNDGSIKYTNLNEIITQGSTTAKIFVAVDGYENTDYTAIARYKLPNKTSSAGNGVATDELILDKTYKGWLFTLTQDETYYYGNILMSVEVKQDTTILFTINVELTINQSGFNADTTQMTITQYSNIISSIGTIEGTLTDLYDEIDITNGNVSSLETAIQGKTALYRHELTIVGRINGDTEDYTYSFSMINNNDETIDNETKLKEQIYGGIAFKGYITNYANRILEVYVYNTVIYICYISEGTITIEPFTTITSIVDEKYAL